MTWAVHLSVQDVGANNASTPSLLRVTIRQSKTDPFWKGVDLYFGKTSSSICPVAAVLSYLMVREAAPGCLFIRTGRSSHVGGSPKQRGEHWLVKGLTTPNIASITSTLESPQLQQQKELGMQLLRW